MSGQIQHRHGKMSVRFNKSRVRSDKTQARSDVRSDTMLVGSDVTDTTQVKVRYNTGRVRHNVSKGQMLQTTQAKVRCQVRYNAGRVRCQIRYSYRQGQIFRWIRQSQKGLSKYKTSSFAQ